MTKYLDKKTNEVINVHPWSKRIKTFESEPDRYARLFEEDKETFLKKLKKW